MPELSSCCSTSSLTKRRGTCSWFGLMQRTKCECVERSVSIRISSCRAYLSATKPWRREPPDLPPPMALTSEPCWKSCARSNEFDDDMQSERSSCRLSVFFESQPSVR